MKRNWVCGILLMSSVGIHNAANAFEPCATRIQNAVAMDFAENLGILVQNVGLIRFEMGLWTEAVGNNFGNASLTVKHFTGRGHHPYIIAHYDVSAQQIGTSSDCKVTHLNKVPSESIDSAILLAESFKLAIGETYYVSEGDSQWDVFTTSNSVEASLPLNQIRQVFKAGDAAVYVYDNNSTIEFLDRIIEDENDMYSDADRSMYKKLKKSMLEAFQEIHLIRVGEDDSGLIELYLVGRRADGRLVGLKAYSIET